MSKTPKTPPHSAPTRSTPRRAMPGGAGTLSHMVPGARSTAPAAGDGAGPISPRRAVAEGHQRLARGDLPGAERLFRQALASAPRNGPALGGLGIVAARAGHGEAAARLFDQARQADPKEPDHGVNLGSALWSLNRRPEALEVFGATARAAPRHRRARQSLASALLEMGHLDAARAEAEALLALDRTAAAAHALLGRVHLRGGRPDAAVAALREATRQAPDHPAHWNDLALALSAGGDRPGAVEALRQALALAGKGPRAVEMALNLAGTLIADQRAEEAEALLAPLLETHPDHQGLRLTLGDAMQRQGRFAESRALFQAVLDHDPANVIALRGVAKAGRVAPGDPVIERLRAASADAKAPEGARVEALYALGKALDDTGDTSGAFAAWAEANAVQAAARPFDAAALDDLVEQSRDVFTADLFEGMTALGDPSTRPVFIVGMPRSGTSLVEQMLASHPAAAGAGELGHLAEFQRHLPRHLGAAVDYPACLYGLKGDVARGFAGHYLARLDEAARRVGKPEAARVSDKLPDNAMRLGLIALLFPRARVVVCRRDPLDTGLSLFQQNFAGGIPYATGLETIGRAMIAHDRLMAHWRDVLPLPMLAVDYETLVTDLEGEGRRLIAFLGLDWDPAVLRFHETDRPVYTASKWQVRQPVFTRSVGRWRRYDAPLTPLRTVLETAGLTQRAI
ncbi:tetratricopeptide repeat-containing sulfotransferase family protein [Roseospira visakhapatnamensis]|uniref:Flp pilus assembly protein TadD n=1 Tax=Roseospira visakhapatnamensis TaxID=390880 RepID=A0A7W6RES9_9PROT|nr:tetratricopeptide repeat-containing sulfotransferase family protein [Roseospira visakhapatnamensis]MBB4266982.1 Flp pilus assembly protein TadD [Roseospira visakhapatnamensis]